MERLSGPSRSGVERPRLIQALSADKTKAEMIYATRPLNQLCRRICYIMDTVARVASVASGGCCQGSFDNLSLLHHILLHRASSRCLVWSTGGGGLRVVCLAVWVICESPNVYRTFREAKEVYPLVKR